MKALRAVAVAVLLLARAIPAAPVDDPRLARVDDWLYVLQIDAAGGIGGLADAPFDVLVIDYSVDGGASGELDRSDLDRLHDAGQIVLAYFSIGEAETYRWYWDPTWNDQPAPDPDAPSWLGPFNPLFPDNYKVRYWQAGWRSILFGTPTGASKSMLDRILDQGFDGIYLDIVDAFEYWSFDDPERTRAQARADMAQLIADLAAYARARRGGFLVFPQNGESLVVDDDDLLDALGTSVLGSVDGIGIEDLYYDETTPQDESGIAFRNAVLQHFRDASRLVLVTDYVWDDAAPGGAANVARYDDFHARVTALGDVGYAAVEDRDLDEIVTVASPPFSVPQPVPPASPIFADGFENGLAAWSGSMR